MKLTNIKDIDGFWKSIDKCKGKVELVTGEGDRLNLKSQLSKFISLSKLFEGSSGSIPELELICYEPEDVSIMVDFMMYH